MKQILNKLKDGALIGLGFLLILGISHAWVNLTPVVPGTSLTDTIWNEMVTKLNDTGTRVSGIFTDGSGNVGIGTTTPTSTLDVNGGINVNGVPLSKLFHIKSSDGNVGCIDINYAPTGYTDDECIWLLNGYSFYEGTTQETFTMYSDANCTSLLHAGRGMYDLHNGDKTNATWYSKIPVSTGFVSELLCQKGLVQEEILY